MFKKIASFKRMALVAMIIAIGATAVPIVSASAEDLGGGIASTDQEIDPSRLEQAYEKLSSWYTFQARWMGNADENIVRIQNLINKATEKGYDASAVQAALDAFTAVFPDAKVYNDLAGAIIAVHAGFDDNGLVTDKQQAIETLHSLRAALKSAHETMNGTGQALKDAIRAFKEAHRPAEQP